jgi:hypothetical protein
LDLLEESIMVTCLAPSTAPGHDVGDTDRQQ